MLARLIEWRQVILLVCLGWLLRHVVGLAYVQLRDRIDRKVPDHLPIGGGPWVLEHAEPRGIRVLQAPSNVGELDAYYPTADVIILSPKVYEKRDASFWAVAAHELGHAIVQRFPFFELPLPGARIVRVAATELATLLLVANLLYARADLHRLAFQALTVSLVAYALVLVDEASASLVGFRILAKDERLGRRDMVAVVATLLAALMTYCAGFLGQMLLVAAREFIGLKVVAGRQFSYGAPLDTKRVLLVGAALLGLVVLSLGAIVRRVRRTTNVSLYELENYDKRSGSSEWWRSGLGLVVIWFVWNQHGTQLPILCVVGVIASRRMVQTLLSIGEWILRIALFFTLGLAVIVVFATAFRLGWKPRAREKTEEPAAEKPVIDFDAIKYAELEGNAARKPPWYERAAAYVFPLLHIGFAIGVAVELWG